MWSSTTENSPIGTSSAGPPPWIRDVLDEMLGPLELSSAGSALGTVPNYLASTVQYGTYPVREAMEQWVERFLVLDVGEMEFYRFGASGHLTARSPRTGGLT